MSYESLRAPRSHFGLRGVSHSPERGLPGKIRAETASRGSADKKRKVLMMAGAGGAALILLYAFFSSGRKIDVSAQVFANPAECVASHKIAPAVCEAKWKQAVAQHETYAPYYPTIAACEGIHGRNRCVRSPSSDPAKAGKYMPGLTGYFFGGPANAKYQGAPLYYVLDRSGGKFRIAEAQPGLPQDDRANGSTAFGLMSSGGSGAAGAKSSDGNGKAVPAAPSPKLQPGK